MVSAEPMPPAELAALIALRDRLAPEYPGFHADHAAWIEARNRIVAANRGLIAAHARRYAAWSGSHTADDLMQAGTFGLIRAAETFDPGLGFAFGTHAGKLIRGELVREIVQTGSLIRTPAAHHAIFCRPGAVPIPAHLVALGRRAQGVVTGRAAADAPDGDPLSWTPSPAGPEPGPLDEAQRRHLLGIVDRHLSPKQAAIVRAIYGLGGQPGRSRDEAAVDLGITAKQVRGLLSEALARLRPLLKPSPDDWILTAHRGDGVPPKPKPLTHRERRLIRARAEKAGRVRRATTSTSPPH